MKWLKRILLGLLGVVVLALLVAMFLPRNYEVRRSLVIQAKPEAIFPHLSKIRLWPEWTAWNTQRDPAVQFTYSGAEEGLGAVSQWTGPKLGNGRMQFTAADPQHGIEYDLSFDDGKFVSKGGLQLLPAGDGTTVVWFDKGDLGLNPVNRYVGLFLDRMIGPDFETGLGRLKDRVEGKPAAPGRILTLPPGFGS